MVNGADKAFNPLRDTIFQGNQSAYDTFGNVAVFVAGSVIPVGAALKAGEPVSRAFIAGVVKAIDLVLMGMESFLLQMVQVMEVEHYHHLCVSNPIQVIKLSRLSKLN